MFFIPLIFWSRTCCRVQHGPYSVVILRRSAWSRSSLFGLAALFCVALVSVVPRCECELVCIIARVLHLVSHVDVPLPLRSKHRGTLRLSVIDLAPRGGGRDGCICRGGRITCQLRQLGPPLCGLPIVCPPRGLLARVS